MNVPLLRKKTSRPNRLALCLILTTMLCACGGGGGDSDGSNPGEPSTPGTGLTGAQQADLIRLMFSAADASEAGLKPFEALTTNLAVVASTVLCPDGGSYQFSNNGNVVPAGSIVDLANTSGVAVSFSDCKDGTEVLNGSVAIDGSLNATVASYRESDTDPGSPSSTTITGTIGYAITNSATADVETITVTATPSAGTVVRDDASAAAVSLVSGAVQVVTRSSVASGNPIDTTISLLSTTFSKDGQTYVSTGSITIDAVTAGNNSGVIELKTAAGTLVGRLRSTPSGLQVEPANGAVEPL